MVYDILKVFKKEYSEKGDKLILGNYSLKEGLYVKIGKNKTVEYFVVTRKKKELIFTELNGNLNYRAYEWFKERDYYSCYLNSNKSFYDKKIHNINYLSFFAKIESFVPKKVLKNEVIAKNYFYLCNYNKFSKPKEKKILEEYREYLSSRSRRKDVIVKFKILRDSLSSIVSVAIQNGVKNYIKIFFDEDVEKYKKESNIYYALKIFNDINFSETIGDKTFGLSNSNMGLNSKKPFLEHKTKFNPAPFLLEKGDALDLKIFFDWLKMQPYKDEYGNPIDRYLDKSFFIQKHSSNDEAEITDFDYISARKNELEKPILIKNYLWLKEGKATVEDFEIEKLDQLEIVVDDFFYNKQLVRNYYGEVWKKLDNSLTNFIYMTRESMIAYFRKYSDKDFYDVMKKYGTKFIIEHIKKDWMFKAGKALNLRLSLLANKGEIIMDIKLMQNKIIQRLKESNYDSLTKDEFFYLCGQIARYLISQSEAYEKKGNMFDPFLKAKDVEKLKEVIKIVYQKYNHKISLELMKTDKDGKVHRIYLKKFGNALSLVMAYSEDCKVKDNYDCFLIGALSDNIFYMKADSN